MALVVVTVAVVVAVLVAVAVGVAVAVMTTSQKYEMVVGGMALFWIAFTYFISKQPGPRIWWVAKSKPSTERRALDELKKLNEK